MYPEPTRASKVISIQPSADAIHQHLERMLADPEFSHSERMSRFLRFVVSQTLAGNLEMLKESVIGVHVFDRDPAYDPKTDPVVRGEARRLRSKLLEYTNNHPNDSLWINLPKGGYVPEFHWRPPVASGATEITRQAPSLAAASVAETPPADRPWIRRHAGTISAFAGIALIAILAAWLFRRPPSYSVLDA